MRSKLKTSTFGLNKIYDAYQDAKVGRRKTAVQASHINLWWVW